MTQDPGSASVILTHITLILRRSYLIWLTVNITFVPLQIFFWRTQVLVSGHWYPCVGFLMNFALVSKPGWIPHLFAVHDGLMTASCIPYIRFFSRGWWDSNGYFKDIHGSERKKVQSNQRHGYSWYNVSYDISKSCTRRWLNKTIFLSGSQTITQVNFNRIFEYRLLKIRVLPASPSANTKQKITRRKTKRLIIICIQSKIK